MQDVGQKKKKKEKKLATPRTRKDKTPVVYNKERLCEQRTFNKRRKNDKQNEEDKTKPMIYETLSESE